MCPLGSHAGTPHFQYAGAGEGIMPLYLASRRFASFSSIYSIAHELDMASSCSLRLFCLQQRPKSVYHRFFHATRRQNVVKPFLLADIGEGTRECQIIQWFVQPGARVEQFDKLCEVQSDKTASDVKYQHPSLVFVLLIFYRSHRHSMELSRSCTTKQMTWLLSAR